MPVNPSQDATRSVLLLAVRDAGPGISPEDQAKLFQNFVQIRPDQLQRGAGSGLGLTIAKRIVELHGGRIGVASTEGRGSCFFFSIPFEEV
jgi:signal transduction histidine kinase